MQDIDTGSLRVFLYCVLKVCGKCIFVHSKICNIHDPVTILLFECAIVHEVQCTLYSDTVFNSYDAYDPGSGIGRYANDAWVNPNCTMKAKMLNGTIHLFLKSVCEIPANTELRYDYNDNTAPWRGLRYDYNDKTAPWRGLRYDYNDKTTPWRQDR